MIAIEEVAPDVRKVAQSRRIEVRADSKDLDRPVAEPANEGRALLAVQLHEIEPDSIEVLTAVLVTWPDGSLGCPEPDMIYATVLTDGSVIELGVDDLVYRYHSGGDRPPFPCDRPLDPAPEPVVGGSS